MGKEGKEEGIELEEINDSQEETDDSQETTKKKLEQEEIFQLFFGTPEQLSQLPDIYKEAYEKKDIKTLQVFFPNIKGKKDKDVDLSKYPKEVEVLNDGNIATVVDKNMPQDEKDKCMESLKKINKLNIFHSGNWEKFMIFAKENGVDAGSFKYNFGSFKMISFYIDCDINKRLELLNGFEKEQLEQSVGKESLIEKAKRAKTESKNQQKDEDADEIELEDFDDKKLELFDGFEKKQLEQSMEKESLIEKAKNAKTESKNQKKDKDKDEIELEDFDDEKKNIKDTCEL